VSYDTSREAIVRTFLADAGLNRAQRVPLPGDASTRRYERLHLPGKTLMLMDAPPSAESPPLGPRATVEDRQAAGYNAMARLSGGRVDAFVATAGWLRSHGLSAPEIVASDVRKGLAVIEDLGDGLFTTEIRKGVDEQLLYTTAVEALAKLHSVPTPDLLRSGEARWPLMTYDQLALATGVDLFVQWYPKLISLENINAKAVQEWVDLWAPILKRGAEAATVFTHRDYHAENLIWLPARDGVARIGMLDFQDAVKAHPAWDLLSLLQDARRDVSEDLEAAALTRYFELRPDLHRGTFMADYAALAALNNTRILGIFARLIVRDHKARYGRFIDRVWAHLERDLRAPGMENLRRWFDRYAPKDVRKAA